MVCSGVRTHAQTETEVKLELNGQLVATASDKAVFVNVGGPALKLKTKTVHFSIGALPSLRFQMEKGKLQLSPILGLGPQVFLGKKHRFIASFPIYYFSSTHIWVYTAGIGWVFK